MNPLEDFEQGMNDLISIREKQFCCVCGELILRVKIGSHCHTIVRKSLQQQTGDDGGCDFSGSTEVKKNQCNAIGLEIKPMVLPDRYGR